MVENSSAGLVVVGSEVQVTVTGESQHQAALGRYRPGAVVAVELGWCTIRSGKYRGESAVEVRLDGQRVGELTYLMTQRYGPLVSRIAAGGGRAGCEAVIQAGARGRELTLRLPRDPDAVRPAPIDEPTVVLSAVSRPDPGAGAAPRRRTGVRAGWAAVAVFVLVVFVAAVSGGDEEEGSAGPAVDSTTTAPVTTTTPTPTPTTTPPPTTTTPPEPTTTERPAPPPREPAPAPEPKPAPEPEPRPDCDPNYTGCVPVDPDDVDCAGGEGNGPSYAEGPVRVIGSDIYGLDRDGDGIACDG